MLISTTLPARTINDRASLETLSRFLAGAPPYRPPAPGGGPPAGGSRQSPAAGPGRAPQPPPHSTRQLATWRLPLHAPLFPQFKQISLEKDARAKRAGDAHAVPDASVIMTVNGPQAKLSSHKAASAEWQPAVGALHIVS